MSETHTPGDWQIDQGKRCGCRGTDEYCGCQNLRDGEMARKVKFNGTTEQLCSSLREVGRSGGSVGAICDAAAEEIHRMRTKDAASPAMAEALEDMLAGWKYIRMHHGDLFGVGWDRAQSKAEAALALSRGEKPE